MDAVAIKYFAKCRAEVRALLIIHHLSASVLRKLAYCRDFAPHVLFSPCRQWIQLGRGKKNTSWSFRQSDLHLKSSLMGITQVPRMVRARGGLALGERGDVKEDSQDSKRR